MTKLTEKDKSFVKLILRSEDSGNGWRAVSKIVWPLVENFEHQELLEIDEENKLIKLSEVGKIVAKYLV